MATRPLWAYYLSAVFLPPVTLTGTALYISALYGDYVSGLVMVLAGAFIPVLILFALKRAGKISNWEMDIREERVLPMTLSLFSVVAGAAWVLRMTPVPEVMACALIVLILTILLLVVSTTWKISVHCTGTGSMSAVFFLTAVPVWLQWASVVVVALMMPARILLQKHTLLQTIVGTLLGSIVTLAVFSQF